MFLNVHFSLSKHVLVPKRVKPLFISSRYCTKMDTLRVQKASADAILPYRATKGAAGYDLSSAQECIVPAHGKALIPTDLIIAVPEGTYGRIAWKNHIDVGAGVIDSDYRGKVGVVLFNHGALDFTVKRGDRVAQLILERIVTPDVAEVDDLDKTDRGSGGFGSTGTSSTVEKK